jgi:hypothetical protein
MIEEDYIKQNKIFAEKAIIEGDTIYYFKQGKIYNFVVQRVVYRNKSHSLLEISCKVPIFSRHFKPYTHFETQTYRFVDRKNWDAFFKFEEEAENFSLKYHQHNIEKQRLIIDNAKDELDSSIKIIKELMEKNLK